MTDDPVLDKPVIAYPGNSTLRKEVGQDFRIANHITEERIRAVETTLREAGDAFFTDAAADLDALETLASTKREQPLDKNLVVTHTYNIRSHAKVLGFTLITEICVHLVNVVESSELSEKKRALLVEKLTEALRFAFTHQIRNDGGEIGLALLTSLRSHL